MSLFSKTEAETYLAAAKTAYEAAISGKRYEIKERSLARQSVDDLYKTMTRWAKYVDDIDNGRDPDNAVRTKRIRAVGL